MANKPSPVIHHSAPQFNLPASVNRGIGRVVARCSYIENKLQTIIWKLLQITTPMGRIATRMPRAEDRIEMIRDLLVVRKISIDDGKLNTLKKNIIELWDRRNLLVHGIWTKPDQKWVVLRVKGNWDDKLDVPVRSRSIAPEAVTLEDDSLNTIVRALEKMIESVRSLDRAIGLEAPPEEHPEQFARKDRAPNRNAKGKKRLRPPSQPKLTEEEWRAKLKKEGRWPPE